MKLPANNIHPLLKPALIYVLVTLVLGSFVWVFLFHASPKSVLQGIASDSLATRVVIGEFALDSEEKTVLAKDIMIFNPEGFSKGPAIIIEQVAAQASQLSREDTVLEHVSVEGISMNLEVSALNSNLMEIHRRSRRKASANFHNRAGKEMIRVTIKSLQISNVVINPSVLLGSFDVEPVSIETIEPGSDLDVIEKVLASEAVVDIMNLILGQALKVSSETGFLTGAEPRMFEEIQILVYGEPDVKEYIEDESKKLRRDMIDMWRNR